MVNKPHAPTSGKDVYLLTMNELTPWESSKRSTPAPWVAQQLEAYPPLLNRFLVNAMRIGVHNNLQWLKRKVTGDSTTPNTRFKYSHGFAEKIVWRDPLRGALQPTDKESADERAIGGLRDTAASVSRLTKTAAFGQKMGDEIMEALSAQHASSTTTSWIDATCSTIGAPKESNPAPPPDAIAAVKDIMLRHIGMVHYDAAPLTKVDGPFLRQWQRKAGDPDGIAAEWMINGAPMGITEQLEDPGIFPEVVVQLFMAHGDLQCD